ncbi:putative Fungal-specific transcription factor domain-containing protein [Seiridium cardinale]|uniref:Fungal-specific transcription factor domain-containing protein n=1 Tax=Seiridium cardinale TaxID=138064 RepID=A0ABR2XH45_9PEZI
MSGPDKSSIPPIEIGTFDAFHPQNSEFIGSSSGVFFVNTVFRAFGKASHPTAQEGSQSAHSLETPSVNELVGTAETFQEPPVEHLNSTGGPPSGSRADEGSSRRIYGIEFPGLGEPPNLVLARDLMILYFQHWHAFYPFLNGRAFFDGVGSFYDGTTGDDQDGYGEVGHRTKLCRAVTYQCIFNLAACAHPQGLPSSSRIQSPSALTTILGRLSAGHDLATLQALLAAELYLVTKMSLRAASTVHGILTRLIYHSGLHRCPFRYIQLPRAACEMRKRILWCAYTIDRYLSQSLGHPLGLQDSEIDVCLPGENELHEPAAVSSDHDATRRSSIDDIQSHMPNTRARHRTAGVEGSAMETPLGATAALTSAARSPPNPSNRNCHGDHGVAVYVQEYLVTYSQLVAEALELFHKSLHARSITREKITELTYRIGFWWNGLPAVFQADDAGGGQAEGPRPPYAAFFTISYHHLLILINRPFLSLRKDTMEFRSSLQQAIGASRGIVSRLEHVLSNPFLCAYPAMLSAAWMAGLVLAFAALLDMYPISKANSEIIRCLEALQSMGLRWSSARHCHHALKALLERLNNQTAADSFVDQLDSNIDERQPRQAEVQTIPAPIELNQSTKRPRTYEDDVQVEPTARRVAMSSEPFRDGNSSAWPAWTPILQYNGPDFGFDAMQLGFHQVESQPLIDFGLSNGLFDDMGWTDFSLDSADN